MKNFKILNFLAGSSIPNGEKFMGKEVMTTHSTDGILNLYLLPQAEIFIAIHDAKIRLNDVIEISGYVAESNGKFLKVIVFLQIA